MLLRFSAQNHYSLKEKQELSLIASTAIEDTEEGLIAHKQANNKILPAAIIYGANASGKSTILSAIGYMRSNVLYSHSKGEAGKDIERNYFLLTKKCASLPSIFDIDFVIDGIRYHYGFEVTEKEFIGEWLYSFPNGRKQNLFERNKQKFTFGRNLKGRNKVIEDLTRPNSLFISAATQNNHPELSKISHYFNSIIIDHSANDLPFNFAKEAIDQRVIHFLNKIGTGVVDYRRKEEDISDENKEMTKELLSVLKRVIKKPVDFGPLENEEKNHIIELGHENDLGEKIYFDMELESDGTTRLLIMLRSVFKALDHGLALLIDELESSLHTKACEAILDLFLCKETNAKGAQLITTTHDTNLLRSSNLRRDQIWFAEKDTLGATHLYPLTDINTRKGDNLEKGYLQGRFGAIPFAGSILDICSD